MLTSEQHDEFHLTGILRLSGAVAKRDADAMCDRVWAALRKSCKVERDNPDTWKTQRLAGTHHFPKDISFSEVGSRAVRDAIDDLLGAGSWRAPDRWGSLLFSAPGWIVKVHAQGRWDVPHNIWHLDFPKVASLPDLFAIRIFTCLARIRPQGGGTVAVAGSSRLADRLKVDETPKIRSADVRKMLIKRYPWFKALCTRGGDDRIERFMNRAENVDGIELRVVEIAGEPGDVILMHPMTLHAPAPNFSDRPRIALSDSVFRKDIDIRAIFSSGEHS